MAEAKANDQNLKGALAYLLGWVTGIAFLLLEKKNEYIRFHAMQSTIVFGAITLLYVALTFIPILGWLVALLISPVIMLVSFVIWLVLMYKAYNGEKYKLPYFGNVAEKQLTKLK